MEQLVLNENKNITIKEYINKYLDYIDVSDNTIKTYNVGLLQFIEYLKNNNIQEPTREDIIAFREYLKQDLSLEEIRKVLNVCKDTREELLVKLMINCGLRCNEVVNIQLQDFYNDKGIVMMRVLGKARNGLKQDSIKIDNRLFELIQSYVKEYGIEDYLFVSTSNNNTNGKLTTKTIRYIITNLFKKADLDMQMLSTHSTRHSTCELLLEKGMPIQEVSEFMRHKSINTTITYSKELEQRNSRASNILCDEMFG